MPTRFTDGKHTVTFELRQLDSNTNQFLPDWSSDFYNTGTLEQTEDGAYIVESVDYLVDAALDWKYSVGDFFGDTPTDPGFRCVWVNGEYLTHENHAKIMPRHIDLITGETISRYTNEKAAVSSYIRVIRAHCDALDYAFCNISDRADPKLVSEILVEVRRAENALSFANNARWRNAQ